MSAVKIYSTLSEHQKMRIKGMMLTNTARSLKHVPALYTKFLNEVLRMVESHAVIKNFNVCNSLMSLLIKEDL